jgi:branched-chain amino acid transport system ATP-binding protein
VRRELVGLEAPQIRALGLARTFQTREVFPNATIFDNLLTGMHAGLRSGLCGALFRPRRTRDEEDAARERAVEVMAMFPGRFGAERWHQPAWSLSFANRCRLEIAMCLMARPNLILVDEPAAGMNPVERVEIVETLKRIRDHGFTLVLVEHNMRVIMGISDRLVVLDRGRKIADGPPDAVVVDQAVTEAYLGDDYDVA